MEVNCDLLTAIKSIYISISEIHANVSMIEPKSVIKWHSKNIMVSTFESNPKAYRGSYVINVSSMKINLQRLKIHRTHV